MLAVVLLIPLASHLPFTFQRALAFLPLKLDPDARLSAQSTLDWRIDMWKALMPEIPPHLLLGKGYTIKPGEYEMMAQNSPFQVIDPSQQSMALSFDYHNGPLSVILPFGIWGVIVFVWFLAAGVRVLYYNYKYGDPALQTINTYLLAAFLTNIISFIVAAGALNSSMMGFVGLLGLNIAVNGGVCRPFRTMSPKTQFEKIQNSTNSQPSPAG